MGIRVRCVDPNAHDHNPRELADSDHFAAFGEVIEVDAELAARLIDQPSVWQLHEDDKAALDQALAALAVPSDVDPEPPVAADVAINDPAAAAGDEHPEEIQ